MYAFEDKSETTLRTKCGCVLTLGGKLLCLTYDRIIPRCMSFCFQVQIKSLYCPLKAFMTVDSHSYWAASPSIFLLDSFLLTRICCLFLFVDRCEHLHPFSALAAATLR